MPLNKPENIRRVPIKKLVDYYSRNPDEAARMRRLALAVLACVRWRNKDECHTTKES